MAVYWEDFDSFYNDAAERELSGKEHSLKKFLEKHFSQLNNKLQSMSTLLEQLQASDATLAQNVSDLVKATADASARISADLGALNDKITTLNAQGALSVSDVQTEISRIQNNSDQVAATVKQIELIDAPAPIAPATPVVDTPVTDNTATEPPTPATGS